MKVSKDRITWESLGAWVDERSIFAMNSDIIKYNDTALATSSSLEKIAIAKQKINSRVINVSGQILASDIEDCRLKQTEIKKQLRGEKLYFYDEYYDRVFTGYCPNINDSINRGEFNGRGALLNFNITLLSPYFESLDRKFFEFSGLSILNFTNEGLDTPYKIEIDIYNTTITDSLFIGKIGFIENLTLSGKIEISTEDGEIYVTQNGTSLLSKMNDGFYTDMAVLTEGENTFTLSDELIGNSTVKIYYYERSL